MPYLGFFQILAEGELTLLKKTDVILKEADRSSHHNAGNIDNKLLKRPELFYATDDRALKLPGKGKLTNIFETRREEMKKFIKTNEIDFDKDNHLIALFDYYNLLIRKPVSE